MCAQHLSFCLAWPWNQDLQSSEGRVFRWCCMHVQGQIPLVLMEDERPRQVCPDGERGPPFA